MHGPLRLTYALLANYMAKCQMSSGPYGPIFFIFQDQSAVGNVIQLIKNEKTNETSYILWRPEISYNVLFTLSD